ncbi:MAG: CDP-alcohol phosphatidyltransferase family protein, partial [Bacilli bacterium]|nr:CDP-alcohol phosphatidyltransferase family protein [Bacilli bacterium]
MKKVTQEWKEVWVPELKNTWKDLKCPKSFYKQIPNLLTASRLLSPIFIIPTILYSNLFVTFIVITFFAFTDFLDGQIARRC